MNKTNLFKRTATRICFMLTGYIKLKGMGLEIEYKYVDKNEYL